MTITTLTSKPFDLTKDPMALDKQEWLESLRDIRTMFGDEGVKEMLALLYDSALDQGVMLNDAPLNTPYINTIPLTQQAIYPGDIALEKRIENIIRWNAMAMVLQAADEGTGVGGHIATYASAATLLEVGFHHVFRHQSEDYGGDMVLPQPHAAPGIYARAYLEGRLTEQQLKNFRRELGEGGGLSSYPHPRSMPEFWQMPNASMGLSTPGSIYQARFAKYLENRGLKPKNGGKIWCFIGDGEADEPEVLGTINIAAREKLDNLVLVINCNLQRLDGPVRGNGKIIQELERTFRGADWQVIKVIWGSGWDALLAQDDQRLLRDRMEACLDGDYQRYSILEGEQQREHWVEGNPALEMMMQSLTDQELKEIKRGGQDPKKIFAAYQRALKASGQPTVLLVKTVKGDGMGSSAQGRNTAHQKKNFSAEERIKLGRDYGIPLDDEALARAAFYKPAEDSEEHQYLQSHRKALGGFLPSRQVPFTPLPPLDQKTLAQALEGGETREVSTTMAMVRMLSHLLRDPNIGQYIVPIVPDEARTFGMDGLFKVAGIFNPAGQQYTPVDAESLMPYREASNGQILQEGICEAGAMASFQAAGSAYAVHGVPTIPFYIFYSMFGFQRVGDMIWSCADMMCKGFLLGGTAGRTTLNGEGLQHQDGHSHTLASTFPNIKSYDPAFSYELAVIIEDGIDRMYRQDEKIFYYITLYNQNYTMPARSTQEDLSEQIIQGGYCFRRSDADGPIVNLLSSGAIMQEAIMAADKLSALGMAVNIWSITSFTELTRNGLNVDRSNRLNNETHKSYVEKLFENEQGVFVAATDYLKSLASGIEKWIPGHYEVLGTDGFGLSESRPDVRKHFEVDAGSIIQAALYGLVAEEKMSSAEYKKAIKTLDSVAEK